MPHQGSAGCWEVSEAGEAGGRSYQVVCAWGSPVGQPELVDYRAGEGHGGGDHGGVFLEQEEKVALFAADAGAGEVLREGFAAGHELRSGRRIDAIAARFQDGVVAAGDEGGRCGFGSGRRLVAWGGIVEARGGGQPVDGLKAGGSGDAEGGASGGHLVLTRGRDGVILAGFLAREELLVGSAGALVHDVEEAIEVGAEFESDAVALGEHESGIDGAPGIAIEAFQHKFHAVGAFGKGPALRIRQRRGKRERGGEADHWCTRWRSATTRESALPVGLTT